MVIILSCQKTLPVMATCGNTCRTVQKNNDLINKKKDASGKTCILIFFLVAFFVQKETNTYTFFSQPIGRENEGQGVATDTRLSRASQECSTCQRAFCWQP